MKSDPAEARDPSRREKLRAMTAPALIDAGAAPRWLAGQLGHVLDQGDRLCATGGVGDGSVSNFAHASVLSILRTGLNGMPAQGKDAFWPFVFRMSFLDQDIPFLLLGQEDFL